MLVNEIACEVAERDSALIADVAALATAFHPDVTVQINGTQVRLSSIRHTAAALRLIWQSALLNERLARRGAHTRAAVLHRLLA